MSLNPVSLTGDRATLTIAANSQSTAIPQGCKQVRVYNGLSTVVFVTSAAGSVAPTASASHTAMAPGATEMFSVDDTHRFLAAYSTGSGSVYCLFGPGE